MKNRIFYGDNGTLTDLSTSLSDYHSGTGSCQFVALEDYIYFGSILPFNHLYLKLGTVNTNSSNLTVDIWDGTSWESAVDLIDETSLAGATFGQSGFITFTPNKNKSWGKEDTVGSNGSEQVTGLGNVTVYDRYWIRLSVSSDFSAGTTLSWAGNLFCKDDDLGSEFPDLMRSNTLAGFEAGKTNWEEQRVRASQIVINDLIDMNIIDSSNQILEKHQLMPACVMKSAEIIFNAFGDDFIDNRNDARKEYRERINKKIFTVDKDRDGNVDDNERLQGQGKLIRGVINNEGFR